MPFLRDCLVAHHDGSGPGVIPGLFYGKNPPDPLFKGKLSFSKSSRGEWKRRKNGLIMGNRQKDSDF